MNVTGPQILGLDVLSLETRVSRVVYRPLGDDPPLDRAVDWAPDERTFYFKSHDAEGRASLWSVTAGGRPRLLVRFPDLNRPSNRPDFAADGKRFYFTLEDRESDVFVAEVMGR